MNTGRVVLSFAIAGATGAMLGVLFAAAKRGVIRRGADRPGARFIEEAGNRPVLYPDVAVDVFDLLDDSALDWADIGEGSVYARGIEDRGW